MLAIYVKCWQISKSVFVHSIVTRLPTIQGSLFVCFLCVIWGACGNIYNSLQPRMHIKRVQNILRVSVNLDSQVGAKVLLDYASKDKERILLKATPGFIESNQ